MKVDIFPRGEIRTMVPVTIEVEGALQSPSIEVEGIGRLTTKQGKHVDQFSAEFYTQRPGLFKIKVSSGSEQKYEMVEIVEQEFLNFSTEFGAFLISLMIVTFGVIVWIKKLNKKNKQNSTKKMPS